MRENLLVTAVEPKPAIVPGTTAQGNGIVTDREDFQSAKVLLYAATVTAGTLSAKIQTGDESDGSDMADYKPDGVNVATTDTIDTTNGSTVLHFSLKGAKKYIRVVTTITGTVSAHAASFTLGDGTYTENFFDGE